GGDEGDALGQSLVELLLLEAGDEDVAQPVAVGVAEGPAGGVAAHLDLQVARVAADQDVDAVDLALAGVVAGPVLEELVLVLGLVILTAGLGDLLERLDEQISAGLLLDGLDGLVGLLDRVG